ncbi:MAG TPA: M28 family peptidase [Gemmatimonadales bacterium]|nr:M28 family peptidase [Gemmatimonadales bacterium]
MTRQIVRYSLGVLLGALLASPLAAQTAAPSLDQSAARAKTDVKVLAADELGGRLTGTAGADSAAAYIARRFAQIGLQPAAGGWFQPFTVSKDAPAVQHANLGELHGKNVIGIIPGRDPALRNETVIIGAHYDHLGLGGFGSLDPDSTGRVHNGADDNASGTAALFTIATILQAAPTARTVVFIAFSGEELGLLGSDYYVKNPIYPLSATEAMINLDMVGRLKNDKLIVYGTGTATEFPALLDSLNWYAKFDLRPQPEGYGPSDQTSFYAAKIPVLHYFSDLHADYHRSTDDWDKINAQGLVRIADFAAAMATVLGNRPTRLTFVDVPPPAPKGGAAVTSGYGAYLGTVPDMASGESGGVLITGVSKGSPADLGGMKGGDKIIKIGDYDVADLAGMTDALRAYRPGDKVVVVVVRDGKTMGLDVTLGKRGG